MILYGFKTWALSLMEDRRLRMLQRRALRRTFGHQREDVKGRWIMWHNEDLYDLYASTAVTEINSRRRKRADYEENVRDIRNARIIFTE
jgi:hypothetical protein